MRLRFFLLTGLAVIFFCTVTLFSSCSFLSEEDCKEVLTLELPQWPPEDPFQSEYPALSRWLFTLESPTSGSQKQYLLPEEKKLSITLEKNLPAAILLQPLVITEGGESTFFKPAGMIYPSRKVYITWEGAYLASIMQRLIKSKKETGISEKHMQDFLSSFNWAKAEKSIDSKIQKALTALAAKEEDENYNDNFSQKTDSSSKSFYNPWLISSQTLLEKLAYGEFSSSLLNNKNCRRLSEEQLQEALSSPLFDKIKEKPLLSSFVLENLYISKEKEFLISREFISLFYSSEDCAIIIEDGGAKNLSLVCSNLPIYLEEKYEKKQNTDNINSCPFSNDSLHKQEGSGYQ